ncbi:hypothetical protein F0562_011841 [Nyssa sinensis]|uniref:Uncharacterized protein n=1 Tax=Nyssa sinensis TaxID=561372 RepID=A0A5J4ZTH9_9ASTE|nr:hypothetical protein F0562_011841 [Nyssa sinensis]
MHKAVQLGLEEQLGMLLQEDIPPLGGVDFENSGKAVGEDSEAESHVKVEEEEEDQASDGTFSGLAQLDEEIEALIEKLEVRVAEVEALTAKLEALKWRRSLVASQAQIMSA